MDLSHHFLNFFIVVQQKFTYKRKPEGFEKFGKSRISLPIGTIGCPAGFVSITSCCKLVIISPI